MTKDHIYVLHTESVYSRGGEKYLYELLRRATPKHTVHLYLHTVSEKWRRLYNREHISVTTLWKPRRLFWLLLPITVMVNYIQLKRRLPNQPVIFATNFPMNFIAVLLTKKTICHCAEPLPIFYDQVRIASLPKFSQVCVRSAKIAYSFLDRAAYRSCGILTTLNRSVQTHVIDIYRRRPDHFLHNGIDTRSFSPKKNRPKKKDGKLYIGHSTDYTVFKGTEDFLAILKHLRDLGVKFRAEISESITDASVKKKYMAYVRANHLSGYVRFIGTLSHRELVSFYRRLDVFVFTGSPEGSGASKASLSVLEASACSVPVFRSIGDDGEILEGKTGFRIYPHNHKQSAALLQHFFGLPEGERAAMGEYARIYVIRRFSWDSTAKKFLTTIQSLHKNTDIR